MLFRSSKSSALEVYEAASPATKESPATPALLYVLSRGALRSGLDPDEFLKRMERFTVSPHPNLVRVLATGRVGETVYVATERIEGFTLAQLMGEIHSRGLPPPLAVWMISQTCSTIAAMSEGGSVQRWRGAEALQLTPSDVYIDSQGRIRLDLLELSEALLATARGRHAALSNLFGYMAPEQVDGQPATEASDLFVCGILLHELLTGERLFAKKSKTRTILAIKESQVPPPSASSPWVDAQLDELVSRPLARAPADRPSRIQEWKEALDAYLEESYPQFTPEITKRGLKVVAELAPDYYSTPAAPKQPEQPKGPHPPQTHLAQTVKTSAQGATLCVEAAGDMGSQPTRTALPAVARGSVPGPRRDDLDASDLTSNVDPASPPPSMSHRRSQLWGPLEAMGTVFIVTFLIAAGGLLWLKAPQAQSRQRETPGAPSTTGTLSPQSSSVQTSGLEWKLLSFHFRKGLKEESQLLEVHAEIVNESHETKRPAPEKAVLRWGTKGKGSEGGSSPVFWSGRCATLKSGKRCRLSWGFDARSLTLGDPWTIHVP